MSARSSKNDKQPVETRSGASRKSASSMKPKREVASGVTVKTSKKTPQEKKAAQKAQRQTERQKQKSIDRKYYAVPTAKYKKLRRWWGICLGLGLALTAVCFVTTRKVPNVTISTTTLLLAYAAIIIALYLDFGPIRKERRRYGAEMEARNSKEATKARKQAKKQAAEAAAAPAPAPAPKKRGLFGGKKKDAAPAVEAGGTDAPAEGEK